MTLIDFTQYALAALSIFSLSCTAVFTRKHFTATVLQARFHYQLMAFISGFITVGLFLFSILLNNFIQWPQQ